MHMSRGRPIWKKGANAFITEALLPPAEVIIASAQNEVPIVWATVPDIVLEAPNLTHNLKQYVTSPPGVPYSLALAGGSAALPAGVTLNASGVLVYDGVGGSTVVSGIIIAATTGAGATISEAMPAPQDGVTADASQGAPSGSVGAITELMPAPADVINVFAQEGPLPEGAGYPTTYTVPSYQEQVFSDVSDPLLTQPPTPSGYATGGTYYTTVQMSSAHPTLSGPQPGWYVKTGNSGVQWNNIGGDWFDRNGIAQGITPWHQGFIPDAGSSIQASMDVDVLDLTRAFIGGQFKNWGMFLKAADTTSTIFWHSRFATDTALRPTLTLTTTSQGTIVVPCGRSLWLNNSSVTTVAGSAQMRTAGTTNYSLLWFDLSAYTNPGDITAATLRLWSSNQFGSGSPLGQTVNVFRVSNPEDIANIGPQLLGLAAGYDRDQGIEAHANVLFVQQHVDANWRSLWTVSGADQYSGATEWMTAPDSNGFTKLAGIYNGLKCRFRPISEIGALQLAFQGYWSPWRGVTGQRLKTIMPSPPEELYMRYYMMFGHDWDVLPDGGKLAGFDGRFTALTGAAAPNPLLTIPGMSRGNSGSGTDGLTGYSMRGNFDRRPTPGSPNENLRTLGNGDMYIPDNNQSDYGSDVARWLNHYLGFQRKGQWFCVEQRIKLNTVTQPNEIPRHLIRIVNNGDNTATATFETSQSGPHWVNGALWSFGGAGLVGADGLNYRSFNRPGVPITVLNSTQCMYPIVSAGAGPVVEIGFPAVGGSSSSVGRGPSELVWISAVPGQGNFDGIAEAWINGRLASSWTSFRWRHSRWLVNGSNIFGIDNAWFTVFHGGGVGASVDASCYVSNIVVATSYIGPLVGYP